ncbi:MAG: phosphohydrolase [Bacteroidetes bacterium]|nr:MAG: phosphohydrolase [Bacteroidota bacterium]RLD73121.1 MAG: phosphohydrolase [Bacteroidota bacterium]RLD87684.1 MAG: phosphohydrolase [Bacteroidota bacterium]
MQVQEESILSSTEKFVKETLNNAEGGHDWWHIYRVWKLALRIAKEENANLFVVQLAALLHDIADSKFHDGDEELGPRLAGNFLNKMQVDTQVIKHVDAIIRNMSFHKTFEKKKFNSLELQVVQDADRLDAIGAIGIARTFNYGGHKNFPIYDPHIKPETHQTKEAYKNSKAPTINHFYEKLFLLKEMMNTPTGKILAEGRHQYMEDYIVRFMKEWDGEV